MGFPDALLGSRSRYVGTAPGGFYARKGGNVEKVKVKLGSLGLGLFMTILPALAHHSFASEYDSSNIVTVTGTVAKVEWTNPHARFYLDVKAKDGSVVTWNLELGSINGLMRQGWTRHSLNAGDRVTVSAAVAKDGSKLASAKSVILANGKKVFSGEAAEASQ